MKKIVLFMLLISSTLTFASEKEYGLTIPEQETLSWSWQKAQTFSGLQSLKGLDGIKNLRFFILSKEQLSIEACPDDPQNCRGLAALYDTKRKFIFIREDLNPDLDTISVSFLIHEMVHALQNETKTEEELFGTCESLYETEKQAYQAQDEFLKKEGQFFRAGSALRFFSCTNENH